MFHGICELRRRKETKGKDYPEKKNAMIGLQEKNKILGLISQIMYIPACLVLTESHNCLYRPVRVDNPKASVPVCVESIVLPRHNS